jgi:hypothetical protein
VARLRDHPLNDHLQTISERAEERYQRPLEDAYTAVLTRIGAEAARRFQRASWGKPIIAAGDDWQPPHPDDIYPAGAGDDIDQAATAARAEMWSDVLGGLNDAVDVSLSVTNPLLADSIGQLGQKITLVTDSQRTEIMRVIQDAHDQGLSIRNTAKAIRDQTAISSRIRATAIARTELTAATNLGGLAAARLIGADTMMKRWVSAEDVFVRPAHQDADAAYRDSPIALDQPFTVGGELLMAPGDPSGSAGNVVNCRCTVIYAEREPATPPPEQPPVEPVEPVPPAEPIPPVEEPPPEGIQVGTMSKRNRPTAPDLVTNYQHRGGYRFTMSSGGSDFTVFVEGSLERAQAQAARITEIMEHAPPKAWRKLKRLAVYQGESPHNAASALKYGMPGFRSGATAWRDRGVVAVWNGSDVAGDTLYHELGHLVGDTGRLTAEQWEKLAGQLPERWERVYTGGPLGAKAWATAAVKDAKVQQKLRVDMLNTDTRHGMTLGPAVTKYGRTFMSEDWAESVMAYLHDRRYGGLGGSYSYRKADGFFDIKYDPRFADLWPNRAKILDKLFGLPPVVGSVPVRVGVGVVAGDLIVRRVVLDHLDGSAVVVKDQLGVRPAVGRRAFDASGRRSGHTHTVPDEDASGK